MNTPLALVRHASLRALNTFGIDVTANALLRVTDVAQLTAIYGDVTLMALPRLVLGGGSNILLTSNFAGLVLQMANRGITVTGEGEDATYVRAAAGENWHQFVLWTLDHELAGLENLALIPGSVGASPVQNIGAYGVEVRKRLHALTAFDFQTGAIRTFMNADCAFSYRDSIFKHALKNRMVILDVTFALPKRWQPNTSYADVTQELAARQIAQPTAREICEAVIAIRQRKLPDPALCGNAGSFFKNPIVTAKQRTALAARFPQLVSYPQADGRYKLAAGWLVDQAGWKGKSQGAAGVSPTQALVLINRGGASGQEVAQLAQAIVGDVAAKFGVTLEPEPLIL